ncbi:uncharacterized protein (TIGR02678 family) [Spinactinospora alkalitolerans]|uniref:Uncharacterized protein (TIGR02678 family) n=1 Tax=Spinactinospora alkalitolerans TaxID=687207 RepID=A0A852U2Y5_9ACTN|nr:TIGR02678 family protein [Spinactinospora alkalitolerans]NYE49875.1 uncharacterized protein (TIGR02678 family) [Spinactinospora alkalitolerans]
MAVRSGNEDIALTVERQAAARRLLADPLVTARSHPEDFALVRTHSDWLVQRFQRVLGYRLTVAADHARLVKTGLVDAVATPLTRASGAHFTPRAYTYLALALAALAEAPARLPLSRLAEDVRAAAEEAGLDLDPRDRMSERRGFVAALRHLIRWGAITERGGALADYVTDPAEEVWFGVDHEVARLVLAHPPHSAPDPPAFTAAVRGDTASDDAGAAELTVRRLLAETAVVYRADLDERRRERLGHHQWRAVAELGELLGCDAEIRAEGVALVMPDDGASDARGADRPAAFPSADPVGRTALVLIGRLAAELGPSAGPAHAVDVPADLLGAELAEVAGADAQRRWSRTALSHLPDAEDLADRVLDLLLRTRLMDRGGPPGEGAPFEGWRLLAAAARYAAPAAGGGSARDGSEERR